MKTIKNEKQGRCVRVSDEEANSKVGKVGWVYCPKSEWKEVRDGKKTSAIEEVKEEAETVKATKGTKNK